MNRYPDLQAAFKNGDSIAQAKKHWQQFGHKEKRNKHCMPDMDDDMAQCYLNRYSDIIQLKTRLQLRPPKSIGSDGVSSKIGIHTVLRDSPTINLNAIYRDTLIYSRPSSST